MTDMRPTDSSTELAAAPSASTAIPEAVEATALGAPAPRISVGRRGEVLYFALRNKKVIGGLTVLLGLFLLGVFAPLFSDAPPNEFVGPPVSPPSSEYWFGTTTFGQDVFIQFVNGLRASFLVGFIAGAIGSVIGMLIGFLAGYVGGVLDELLNAFTNVVLVLPVFVVLIVISTYVGINNVTTQSIIIGVFAWPWVARAVRAQTFTLRVRDYVDLARLTGRGAFTIIRTEIAPMMYSYLVLVFILSFGGAVLTAAFLDFLGLGPHDGISLGLMLNQAVQWSAQTLGMWWWFIPPGAGIALIVGAAYVTNVGLDEVFNPRLREM